MYMINSSWPLIDQIKTSQLTKIKTFAKISSLQNYHVHVHVHVQVHVHVHVHVPGIVVFIRLRRIKDVCLVVSVSMTTWRTRWPTVLT